MIINSLLSRDGLRAARVDLTIGGLVLGPGQAGLSPRYAEELRGTVLFTLADLSAAIARPEVVNDVLAGVNGLAKPEFALTHGERGGVRFTGSVELLGRRFPISATSDVRIEENRLVLSATSIRGLPVIRAVPVQFLTVRLPLSPPPGITFTGVTVEAEGLLVSFEGRELDVTG